MPEKMYILLDKQGGEIEYRDLSVRPRNEEQVVVIKAFARGNQWKNEPVFAVPVLTKVNAFEKIGRRIPIDKIIPEQIDPTNGYILIDVDGDSICRDKPAYSRRSGDYKNAYVNSPSKAEELTADVTQWNGNPPVKAIPAVWSKATGVKILGDPITIETMREMINNTTE